MNFKLFKSVALIASLGAMVGLYSCNSDEDFEQEAKLQQEVDDVEIPAAKTISLSAEEFDALVEEVKNDTAVKSYSVFDPNSVNSLKSITDSYSPIDWFKNKLELYELRGLRLSGHLRAKMQGYISDKKSDWYGWYIFDVDLNDGAGGDYLYLAARFIDGCSSGYNPLPGVRCPGNHISSLSAYNYIPKSGEIVRDSQLNYFNCNSGTKKGGPIYLGVTRGGNKPITGLMIVSRNSRPDASKSGYTRFDYDMNKGAGGDYVYIYYRY